MLDKKDKLYRIAEQTVLGIESDTIPFFVIIKNSSMLGLSQNKIAELTGTSQSNISTHSKSGKKLSQYNVLMIEKVVVDRCREILGGYEDVK